MDAGSKFKVGDLVRAIRSVDNVDAGKTYAVTGYARPTDIGAWVMLDGVRGWSDDGSYLEKYFEPVTEPPSPHPIRTVTRREIVPGVYGRVTVKMNVSPARMSIGLTNIASAPIGDTAMSADELREAAHIFNQIAEALEENAKGAA